MSAWNIGISGLSCAAPHASHQAGISAQRCDQVTGPFDRISEDCLFVECTGSGVVCDETAGKHTAAPSR